MMDVMPCAAITPSTRFSSAASPMNSGTPSGSAVEKPVERLSITTTLAPDSTRARTVWLPM
ncbi:hypothetical protein BN961_00740 [Afipia felis]|uniref:Uncharacterized protein n=1 Tax=Afipia felis TaxID=1035 RepID=A0A090MIP9_AFIFE|nr:hypothetical protein BN961_00740 [Afipia felis]